MKKNPSRNSLVEKMIHARPHPGPLPRGEGESLAALSRNESLVDRFVPLAEQPAERRMQEDFRQSTRARLLPPLPGGEGRGEGEQNHKHFRSAFTPVAWSFLLLLFAASLLTTTHAAEPLRVFIRAGVKTHGPNQHDHPRFLAEWKRLQIGRAHV